MITCKIHLSSRHTVSRQYGREMSLSFFRKRFSEMSGDSKSTYRLFHTAELLTENTGTISVVRAGGWNVELVAFSRPDAEMAGVL